MLVLAIRRGVTNPSVLNPSSPPPPPKKETTNFLTDGSPAPSFSIFSPWGFCFGGGGGVLSVNHQLLHGGVGSLQVS